MPSAVMYSGKWRIKPSGKLPIFLRFVINSSFTKESAKHNNIKSVIGNRTFLNHMMYWRAEEYNSFENEIVDHLKKDDGWFEKYVGSQLKDCEHLYQLGLKQKKVNWTKKTNSEIKKILTDILQKYRLVACSWYAQYPLDEFFETAIENKLLAHIQMDSPDFRKFVLIFTDPLAMTEVAEERWKLTKLAKQFFAKKENLDKLSPAATQLINQHLNKFAYINRGLGTSKPYSFSDIVSRLKEMKKQTIKGDPMNKLIYNSSAQKVVDEYKWAVGKVKPDKDFLSLIKQAREHSYMRNRRVEAFFNADYGCHFMYEEIARRAKFNPEWIMDVSVPEMFAALEGHSLPDKAEMQRRIKDYAMIVRNAETKLVSDPKEIKKLEKRYFVKVKAVKELHGVMACLGGIIRGRAKVCLDKSEIGKVKTGDILVTQFTTPDFVPAMERAAAIVADQGGLSSHAAIVSRELGVPCVIATKTGTRNIKDNDLLEIDARKGIVRILNK